MVESRRSFVDDVLYSFLPFVASKLRAIVLIPIITKSFGSVGYGLWIQYSVTLVLISMVASLGLHNSMNRWLPAASDEQVREDYYSVLAVSIVATTVVSTVLVALRDPIARVVFDTPDGAIFPVLLAVALLFNIYFRQTVQFLRSQRRIRSMNLWRGSRIVGEIGCILIGTTFFSTFASVVWLIVGLYALFTAVLAAKTISEVGFVVPRFTNLSRYLSFGLPLLFSSVAYWVVNTSDRYLISYFLGIGAVGSYSVVYSIAALVGVASNPIVNVLFPDLSALVEEGSSREFRLRLERVLRYYLVFTLPAAVGASLLATPLIGLISTSDIARAAWLMPYLAGALLLYGLFNILIQVLKSYDRAVRAGVLWGGIAVLNVVLNVALLPVYGISGAAIATLLSFLAGSVVVTAMLYEEVVRLRLDLGRIVAATALMAAVVWTLERSTDGGGIVVLTGLVAAGAVTYFGVSYYLGTVSREEFRTVRSVLADR